MKTRALLVAGLTMLGGAGCAFEPGEPFGVVDATFDASLERRGGRFTEDGALLPVGSWEVQLDRLVLEVDEVRLVRTGDGATTGFNPSKPPPGWFCHADHCHTPDDDLVSYDEAAVILAGGASGPTDLVAFPLEETFDLLEASGPMAVPDCRPDCVVGRGATGLVIVEVGRLVLEGTVRDLQPVDRLDGQSVPIFVDLDLDGLEIASRIADPIRFDRGERPYAELDLHLLVHPSLLDGLPFDALVEDGAIVLAPAGQPEAVEMLLHNLEASRVRVDVTRLDLP